MGFFEENKALVITVLLFSVLLLAMYNINISNANKTAKETLIDLQSYRPEEPHRQEEEKSEVPPPAQQARQSNVQTHQAYNQNQEASSKNFESRLDEIFKKNSAERTAAEAEKSDPASGEFNLNRRNNQQPTRQSDGNNSSEDISAKTGTMKNSSISFSLVGRRAIDIPNPIYTCESSGKIVVNITVNSEGMVTDTSINKASSTSSNQCLTEKALEYAAGAVFSRLQGRNSQPGTITYNFQGQ